MAAALLATVTVEARALRRARKTSTPVVQVEMRNVRLHVTDHVALNVRSLRGAFVAARAGGIPDLDDRDSYVVNVDAGEIAIDEASLNDLMNEHVFVGHKSGPRSTRRPE